MSWLDALKSFFQRRDVAAQPSEAPALPPVQNEPPPMPTVLAPSPAPIPVPTPPAPAVSSIAPSLVTPAAVNPTLSPASVAPLTPAPRLTTDILMRALGVTATRATRWAYPLEEAMSQFGIITREQRAAFLAQCGHESGLLLYTREIWGPTAEQSLYEPITAKSRALGNTMKGDGFRYRGGGLIQTTGRYNYRRQGERLGIDLEGKPELIETPQYASLTAAVFWADHELNQYADRGEFDAISKAINLGNPLSTRTPNGNNNRRLLWNLCMHAYSIA